MRKIAGVTSDVTETSVRRMPKIGVTQHENFTMSYWQLNEAIFQRDMSFGSEEDTYTVLNLAVAATPDMFPEYQEMLNNAITNSSSSLFQARTVKELLWGYNDSFLEQIPLPDIDTSTGVFYPYNGTVDGPYNVYNGKDDISCNHRQISGKKVNDAVLYPPFVKQKNHLYLFLPDACRSLYGVFQREYKLKGIKINRFVVPKEVFASSAENPDNHCFCKDMKVTRNCTVAGILELRACRDRKPIFLSLPHFLHGSQFLLDSVGGLKPNEDEHRSYIDVEPTSLITDDAAKDFKSIVINPMKTIEIVAIQFVCVGSAMLLGCSIPLCIEASKKGNGMYGGVSCMNY
ncbi:hypothetical protein XELAEV_18017799mg [Xenopus laevis]|uniref:Platelet glycoprotein 4 n=1 Tax=Xenopus laevis TaxID=8355 RepID=A0A974DC80_XENLA|nr:hypothetical protein XELAEV_18017799mg [Xenopus laevis]